MRHLGWGDKVAVVQFIKGYKETGEWKFAENNDLIDFFQDTESNIRWIGKPEEKDQKIAKKSLARAKKIIKEGKYKLVILDEINNAMEHGLVEVGEIIKMLKSAPKEIDFILTGRGAPKEIIKIADLVTEMTEVKHQFQKGVQAKKGIDY